MSAACCHGIVLSKSDSQESFYFIIGLSRSIEPAIKHANADFNYHHASFTCKIRAKEEVGKDYLLFA